MINHSHPVAAGAWTRRERSWVGHKARSLCCLKRAIRLAACLFSVALASCGCSGTPAVELHLEPESVTIGIDDVDSQDLSRELEVSITNNSSKSYRIVDVISSCACTLAGPLSATLLAPGEHCISQFRVTVPRVGKTVSWAEIVTEPASVPPLRVRFELIGGGDHVPRIEVTPSSIPLIGEIAGERVEAAATVTTLERAGSEHWLTGAEADSSDFQVHLRPTEDDEEVARGGVRRRYSLDLIARVPAERFGQRVQIHLLQGRPRAERIVMNPAIWAAPERRSAYMASPEVITLSRIELAAAGGQGKKVLLFGDNDDPAADWNVQAPDWVSVKIQPPETVRERLVAVAVIEPVGSAPSEITDVEILVGRGVHDDSRSVWRIVLHVSE